MIITDKREFYMEVDRSYYYTAMGIKVISKYDKVNEVYTDKDHIKEDEKTKS